MSDEYYVKLTGNLMEGRSPDLAAQFLSDSFHIPWETGRTYFNGSPTVLKKKLDRETAEKVCHRLRNTGAECEIEAVPDLGFTLELVEDSPEASPASNPEPAPEPAAAQAPAQEDDFSLELVDAAPAPAPQPELQPPAELEDELHLDTPDPSPQQAPDRPPAQPPAPPPPPGPTAASGLDAPAPASGPPPVPTGTPAESEEDKSEQVDIGDVSTDVGAGVGGMLPQASTAPSFRRPGLGRAEEGQGGPGKKMLLPLAAGAGLLALAATAYFLLLTEPAPPPAPAAPQATTQPQTAPEPVEIDNSMIIALQRDELNVRFDNLLGTIATWQEEFAANSAQASTPEQLKAALKTDMGITEQDWQDPWGGSIEIRIGENGFKLVSPGPDQELGNADDVLKEQ
ncbi:hypothetical protein D5125_03505 [Magnetovirga frankeli]|uniref:hypothetical protein n=1 Tax=Magnetovirga frankeli TaxID=947516 RepID=UPI001293C9FC|nr:hypothetical protein D5125_03505 [gamma proteobacterium SS-5]